MLITISLFLFTSFAQAKVTYNNTILQDMHMNTIKGLLYDTVNSQEYKKEEKKELEEAKLGFTKAIVWLTKHHNDKAIYKLTGGTISGHTLKHIFAALDIYLIIIILEKLGKV